MKCLLLASGLALAFALSTPPSNYDQEMKERQRIVKEQVGKAAANREKAEKKRIIAEMKEKVLMAAKLEEQAFQNRIKARNAITAAELKEAKRIAEVERAKTEGDKINEKSIQWREDVAKARIEQAEIDFLKAQSARKEAEAKEEARALQEEREKAIIVARKARARKIEEEFANKEVLARARKEKTKQARLVAEGAEAVVKRRREEEHMEEEEHNLQADIKVARAEIQREKEETARVEAAKKAKTEADLAEEKRVAKEKYEASVMRDEANQRQAGLAAEVRRNDPADGKSYTYKEVVDFYSDKYSTKQIAEYWEQMPPVTLTELDIAYQTKEEEVTAESRKMLTAYDADKDGMISTPEAKHLIKVNYGMKSDDEVSDDHPSLSWMVGSINDVTKAMVGRSKALKTLWNKIEERNKKSWAEQVEEEENKEQERKEKSGAGDLLPEGWKTAVAQDGTPYYFNKEGKSQWEVPVEEEVAYKADFVHKVYGIITDKQKAAAEKKRPGSMKGIKGMTKEEIKAINAKASVPDQALEAPKKAQRGKGKGRGRGKGKGKEAEDQGFFQNVWKTVHGV